MKYLKLVWIIFFIVNSTFIIGQETDTLEIAKELNLKKQYSKSTDILQIYYSNHKDDLYAGWLYAQTLHQTKDHTNSIKIYKLLIKQFPDNDEIKLDLINKLTESHKFSKAIIQINEFIPNLSSHHKFIAQKTLAQILYWQGNYDQSLIEIDKALSINTNDLSAIDLRNKIIIARSHWLKIDLGYLTDDQPLTKVYPKITTGFYINTMVSLGLNIDYAYSTFSDSSYSTPWIKGMAKFNFPERKAGARLEVGSINYSSSKEQNITGLIEINKRFSKYFNIVFEASYQPYLATTFSINEKLMQAQYVAAIEYNNPHGFIGEVSIRNILFPSIENSYYAAGGWIVSPPLRIKKFDFRVGYGINFSDSENSNFVAIESLDSMITNWDSTLVVKGNYNPFFSPNKQTIHSVVGIVKYSPNKKLSLGFDVNYGFNAESNSPYLYLGEDSENEIIIVRDFYNQSYNPMDINGFINYEISDAISIKGYYKYKKTYYYESHYAGIIAQIVF